MRWGLYGVLTAVLFATPAMAGWVSGGGELQTDASNPWFLENTRDVHYCIEIAPGFPHEKTRLKALIETAVSYWQDEFSRSVITSADSLQVATQRFWETECGSDGV